MANISEDPLLLDKHTSEEPFTSTKRDRALSSVKVCPGSCLLPPIMARGAACSHLSNLTGHVIVEKNSFKDNTVQFKLFCLRTP